MTSTMLALRHEDGTESVLRLMTNEPWRTHGAELTAREREAQLFLAGTAVPAPASLAPRRRRGGHRRGRAPDVPAAGLALVRGRPRRLRAMADLLATIHSSGRPSRSATFQSWAWPAKWVVPAWTQPPRLVAPRLRGAGLPRAGVRADVPAPRLRPPQPALEGGAISGVVDWVETSTGPAWLDAAHAASNLAVVFGTGPAAAFVERYAALAGEPLHQRTGW